MWAEHLVNEFSFVKITRVSSKVVGFVLYPLKVIISTNTFHKHILKTWWNGGSYGGEQPQYIQNIFYFISMQRSAVETHFHVWHCLVPIPAYSGKGGKVPVHHRAGEQGISTAILQ